jgi:drug/metabolite transporter (DMT)-like permease
VRRRSEWQGSLLILLSAACFGAGSIFGKAAYAAGADVLTFLFLRFLIASVLLWLGIAVTGHRWPALSPRSLAVCVALGAVGYAPQSLIFFTALRYISASLAALILYTYPPIVTLLAMVILGEGLDRWKVMALGTAAVGLLLTLSRGLGAATGLGVGLVLLSAVSFSVYIVVSRMVLRGVPSLAASAVIIPSACAAFGLYGGLAGQLRFGLSSGAYLAIVGMAVVSTVLAIVMFFAGLERVGASRAAILSTVEPVVTLSLGAALLGERLTLSQVAGGACIVGAVLLLHGAPLAPEPGR